MDSRFIIPLILPLTLISLSVNPQTVWAGRCQKPPCIYTPPGRRPSSILPPELTKLEDLIAQKRATAVDFHRAGELYTQIGDKAMAETRFKEARTLYRNLGDLQGVNEINKRLGQ